MVTRLATKILIDGGDPDETTRVRNLLDFLDGQTTNPTLVSKNPDVRRRRASGHKLTVEEQTEEYKLIVQKISPLVGDAGVSIEVFADLDTTAEQMLEQGREMFSRLRSATARNRPRLAFSEICPWLLLSAVEVTRQISSAGPVNVLVAKQPAAAVVRSKLRGSFCPRQTLLDPECRDKVHLSRLLGN